MLIKDFYLKNAFLNNLNQIEFELTDMVYFLYK